MTKCSRLLLDLGIEIVSFECNPRLSNRRLEGPKIEDGLGPSRLRDHKSMEVKHFSQVEIAH